MKKLVVLLLTVIMAVVGAFSLASCGGSKKQTKMIDVKLTDEVYAIAVSKDKTSLKADINAALKELNDAKTIDEIIAKYQDVDSVTTGYEFPSSADGVENPLIVATNAEFPPFEYKLGNKYAGIDIEIIKAIADKLNKNIVMVNMNFDAVVTSVAGLDLEEGVDNTGYDTYTYSDVAIVGLSVTEDRQKVVDFTDTYFTSAQVLVVKKDDTTFDGLNTAEEIEAKLKELTGKKVGSQTGTTGEYYVKGSGDWLEGFDNLTFKGYTSHALAIQDMLNGNIDFVVSDYETAKALVKKF
ncbi:MAG: transporter substrate-binding domain-containing protein [Clostridia bacterium]|nr:transporter substrate-binding domain-containing protein [Clostridia bacterium]